MRGCRRNRAGHRGGHTERCRSCKRIPIEQAKFRAAHHAIYDSGFTQAEIAARIGKSQGHVSTAMILARCLAPAVVARLAQLLPNTIPFSAYSASPP